MILSDRLCHHRRPLVRRTQHRCAFRPGSGAAHFLTRLRINSGLWRLVSVRRRAIASCKDLAIDLAANGKRLLHCSYARFRVLVGVSPDIRSPKSSVQPVFDSELEQTHPLPIAPDECFFWLWVSKDVGANNRHDELPLMIWSAYQPIRRVNCSKKNTRRGVRALRCSA